MEIERKFIVHNLPDNLDSYPHSEIEQGYLCMEPVIRIRRMNKQYFLTFKSKGLMARTEHEFPLDKAAYEHLLPKVDGILISKTRYKIPDEHGFIIELDVFHGEYEGLVMAEVEFPSEEVAVEYEGPEWFDDEVTFDSRYQNNTNNITTCASYANKNCIMCIIFRYIPHKVMHYTACGSRLGAPGMYAAGRRTEHLREGGFSVTGGRKISPSDAKSALP